MEFNSINFNLNNIANQKAGLVQNNIQNNSQNQPQQMQPQTQNQQIIQQNINPSLMYNFQLAKMDNETVLKYLQNLLNLPNSIDNFVNQLNSKNVDPKLAKILVENMISTKMLGEFLNQNSTVAISKLMQTISTTLKSGVGDVTQLKEVLSILGAIQNSTTLSQNAIKELLLLYIPLNAPIFDKNIDGKIKNEEKEITKNSKLSILFETINFSNLLITINEIENNLFIDLYTPNIFPKREFSRIFKALSKEISIASTIDFKDKQKADSKNISQNFKIISDGFISPNELITAHIIIQIILKIDNEYK